MLRVECCQCGKKFVSDPYNFWRELRYCRKCAKNRRRLTKWLWRQMMFAVSMEWRKHELMLQAACQRLKRAKDKALKEAAVIAEAEALEAARAREEAARALAARQDAELNRLRLMVDGIAAFLSGSKTLKDLARFSARMVDKGISFGSNGTA